MDTDSIIFQYEDSELHVVPAIHFNHIFAEKVNRICHNPGSRPEAVAVELGPRAATNAEQWLRELAVGHKALPVMLGLIKRNMIIRASLKQKALQLQRDTGLDLSELSPDILKRELGYNGCLLLLLSPTDSIIEAIRCAIDFDVPVFGIDLDDMADGIFKPVQVQRPLRSDSLTTYIDQNAQFAELQRDEEIDRRREIAMAARIKTLLKNYRRVLFTCGMAHWLRIKDLLQDDSIKPSLMPERTVYREGEYSRVIVHPAIAIKYMDLFPILSVRYEKSRLRNTKKFSNTINSPYMDATKIFHEQLIRAYCNYFQRNHSALQGSERGHDIEKLDLFERYLENFCLLSYRPVPDLCMIIHAAQEVLSEEFTQSLTKTFMNLQWASPEKFPNCTLLSPSSDEECDGNSVMLIDKEGYPIKDKFYIRSVSAKASESNSKIPFEWEEARKLIEKKSFSITLHTWLPWDRLITSLSLRAIKYTCQKKVANKAAEFEGSLLNGLDIKHTVRSFSRGDERYYVRALSQDCIEKPNFVERFPVVWLFHPEYNHAAYWNVLRVPPPYMEKYIKDKTAYEHFMQRQGHDMVSIIGYCKSDDEQGSSLMAGDIRGDHSAGLVIFHPICWTNKQFAHWAENTRYRRAPFSDDCSLRYSESDLSAFYREKHGIKIGEFHWTTTMILLAIPFAKEILTVVIPNGYQIDKVVYAKAKKYGVEIRSVSHNLFSQTDLERVSRCHLVPAMRYEPQCLYSEEVEALIGEKQTDNTHLVPNFIRNYGKIG